VVRCQPGCILVSRQGTVKFIDCDWKYVSEVAPSRKETGPRPRPVWDTVATRVKALLAEVRLASRRPFSRVVVQWDARARRIISGLSWRSAEDSIIGESRDLLQRLALAC